MTSGHERDARASAADARSRARPPAGRGAAGGGARPSPGLGGDRGNGRLGPALGRARGGARQIGFLILDGIVICELLVEDTVSAELLGPGDVVRPAGADSAGDRLLPHSVRWSVLSQTRVARLDARLAARLAAWPEVNAALIDRLNARAQRLATTQAISQLNGVDRRLHALLWHLAERWGRMTKDGVRRTAAAVAPDAQPAGGSAPPVGLDRARRAGAPGRGRAPAGRDLAAHRRADRAPGRGDAARGADPAAADRRCRIRARRRRRRPTPAPLPRAPDPQDCRPSCTRRSERLHADTEAKIAALSAAAAESRRLLAETRARLAARGDERGVAI